MYRMIALDIDGTLVGKDGRVSAANRAAIAQAKAAGLRVVLCTGRSWQESEEVAAEIGCDPMMVCQGGAALADLEQRRNTRLWEIPQNAALALLALLEDQPLGFVYFSGSELLVNPGSLAIFQAYPSEGFHRSKRVVEHPLRYFQEGNLPLNKIFACGDPACFPPLLEGVRACPEVTLTSSAWNNFEILPAGIDKGTGLAALAAGLGIGMEEIIAIGDSPNDMAMLSAVGMPVAMGNAPGEVKALARYVTAANEADGVAQAIRHVLGL